MKITKELLASKILEYLNRRLSAYELAIWAEDAMVEGNYQEQYFSIIAEALAAIGTIDVKGFELPIAFYLNILIKLDFLTIFGLEPKTEKINELVYA
jgi:hypothetical protein